MVFLQGKDFPAECRFFMRRKACDGRSADEQGPDRRQGGQDGSHKRFLKGSVVCVREDGGIGVL